MSGYDAGKKVKGRKRHLLVDTLGLMLSLIVLPANIPDRAGALYLLNGKQYFLTKLKQIYADGGYKGQDFAETVKQQTGWNINIVKRSGNSGFTPLPKRWIVERTFAWLNKSRRLSKDYELHVQVSEGFIQMAMIRLMLRRMTKPI